MAFSYYGNFGGPGWTNGSFEPPGTPDEWGDGIDPLDELFKNHDKGYYEAEEKFRQTGNLKDYWSDIIRADNEFLRDVVNIPRSPDWLPNDPSTWSPMDAAADSSRDAFVVKQPYNYSRYLEATINATIKEINPADLLPQWNNAQKTVSPLILDLDGDNVVETVAKSQDLHFDHSADGFAENTGWAGKDDGLLVRDLNANGTIDTGRELFGNQTLRTDGTLAANGFEALKDLDSNQDGKITSLDAQWSTLRVWKDADGDAVTDAGELLTLAEAGVQSINVGYSTSTAVDAQGNQHRQVGSYTTTTGATRGATDVWFDLNLWDTTDQRTPLAITTEVAALPELMGSGTLGSLHQAMARDGSGQLTAAVRAYAASTSTAERASLLQDILYHWAGVQDIDPGTRGPYIDDGRKLGVLEAIFGDVYVQGGGGTTGPTIHDPGPNAANVLLNLFNNVAARVAAQLDAQTHDKPYYNALTIVWEAELQSFKLDASGVVSLLRSEYAADADTALQHLDRLGSNLNKLGTSGSDFLLALQSAGDPQGDEIAQALLNVGIEQLLFNGSTGDDSLTGNSANNYFHGLAGSDSLQGGEGSDTYYYNRGDGQDTILDIGVATGGSIRLGADILAGQVSVSRGTGVLDGLVTQWTGISSFEPGLLSTGGPRPAGFASKRSVQSIFKQLDQLPCGYTKRARKLNHGHDGRHAYAALQHGHIGAVNTRFKCQSFLRQFSIQPNLAKQLTSNPLHTQKS